MLREHLLVVPLLVPLAGALLAAVPRGRLAAWVVLATTLVVLVANAAILAAAAGGPVVYRAGGWAPPYGIVLVADLFSAALAVTASIVAAASALHTLVSGGDEARRRLYHPSFLVMLLALGGVFLTGDLFNLYVFMELTILSSIVLVAIAGRPISAETAFKYSVLAAIGSTLLLVSVAFVYAGAGTLALADVARRVREGPVAPFWPLVAAMMLAAFLLKGAVFPLHFWQPDAHSAAPAPVSAMLSGVLVKVGIYGIVRMGTLLFPEAPALLVLAPLGAITALFGGLAAIANADLKRLLAYSTISNVGLIVLALGWGFGWAGLAGQDSHARNLGHLALAAAIVHTINHALIKGGLFLAGGYVTERLDEHGLAQLGGLARLTPAGTVAFGLGALALAGLPPFGGYVGKLALFRAGVDAGDAATLGAVVAASVLAIVYCQRAFVRVFWGESPPGIGERWRRHGNGGVPAAPLLLALAVLALGLWPAPLITLATAAAGELAQPRIYIDAVLGEVP